MGDICEIKRRLAERAQSVAEYLLPNGRKDGREWRAGSVSGEPGKSLGVHLAGPKAGVWSDFNGGTGGDLLDLWMATRGVSLVTALDEARSWLGIERPEFVRPARREYARPPKPKCHAPKHAVLAYLTEDRNIPAEILTRYRVSEEGQDTIVFPFLLLDGTLALAKRRKAEDGAKPVPTARDCEPVLFGWQALPENAREVILTEGEIDALSWAAYGQPAMSVPFGGGGGNKQQWIESEFERLERFERIYLATDMDPAGEEAAEEIANRLGRHRCLRVEMPHKDANECLVEGVSPEVMAQCLRNARHLDPEGLKRASDYRDAVVELFWPDPSSHVGYETPYAGHKLRFRPGEVTLWQGASGSGKSQILSDCTVDWVRQGSRICLSSLEMHPAQTLKRMVKQTTGTDRPTDKAITETLSWLDGGLLIYELVGKAKLEQLFEAFEFARAKYGCDQFIIDSLMRLGVASDDYVGQEKAMFDMVDWAISKRVHLHLVAHSRKGEKGAGPPDTEEVKGAMEIGANAFNILGVWRNRKLEEQIDLASCDEEREELRGRPGVILNVSKQRNGDWEGKIKLCFDRDCYQYRPPSSKWPRRYLHGEALEAVG